MKNDGPSNKTREHPMHTFKVIVSDCKLYRKYLCKRYRYHTAIIISKESRMSSEDAIIYSRTISAVMQEIQKCNRIIYTIGKLNTHAYETYSTFLRNDYDREKRHI